MKFLIIGGTKFLGRYLVESATARGHEVTLFNRGLTNPDLFPNAEHLQGDRNEDLQFLRNREWDAVIDTCGYTPSGVGKLLDALSGSIKHYTFISSLSVYAHYDEPNQDETAPLKTTSEDLEDEANPGTYSARKAACEQLAEKAMPGRVLSIRAGLIVGPNDYIDRFAYWVNRVSQGGEVLAPVSPERPMQLIDVRDLAEWNIKMVEEEKTGIYNATGPDYKLTFGKLLESCRAATGSDAAFTWVSEEFLMANNLKPWSEIPFWLPGDEGINFLSVNCSKAFQDGLKFRPLIETTRDTLDWYLTRDPTKQEPERPLVTAQGQIGLKPEQEKDFLRLWQEK